MTRRTEVVLVDLGGVVYTGDTAIAGSLNALNRLKEAGLPVRYITNTTRLTAAALLEKLRRIGLDADPGELFTPARAALEHLRRHDLAPHLLVHPALEPDFEPRPRGAGRALVVGDAGDGFTYRALDEAFEVLQAGADFLALARNRCFRDSDGKLHLDAGPFVAALEFAAGREAVVLGKPSKDFFLSAVDSAGAAVQHTVMIGDDAESDVAGAMNAGIRGILVRTGKYQPGAEGVSRPPDMVVDDLAAAVDRLLEVP